MSHSQFYCVVIYTQTCMAQSLRQAYDYWQNQPGTTWGKNPYSKLQLEKIIHDFCEFAMQKHSINGLFIFLNCNQLVFKIINYSLKIFIECLEIENLFANLTLENT